MKFLAAAIASLSLMASSAAHADPTKPAPMLTRDDVRTVSPALDKYTQERLLGDVWKRPGLGPRDRSIVTLAALVARNQTIEMPYYVNLALDHGVKPREISELITHLAFYSGWPNAMSAVALAKDIFAARKIGADELPSVSPPLLPIDQAWETAREKRVREQFGAVFPGMVQNTRCSVSRPLASPRPCAARPQPRHRQRADRQRPGRAADLASQQGDG